jgi:hypothetical protein
MGTLLAMTIALYTVSATILLYGAIESFIAYIRIFRGAGEEMNYYYRKLYAGTLAFGRFSMYAGVSVLLMLLTYV